MVEVVGIEPCYDLHTKYGQAFRRLLIYSHKKISPSGYKLTCLTDIDTTPDKVHRAVQANDVKFITGFGHGNYETFYGQNEVTIWDIHNIVTSHVKDKIIHLTSCKTGGMLGKKMIEKGAKAFWGYNDNFCFYYETEPPDNIIQDKYAKPFFEIDALIDCGILNGSDASQISHKLFSCFWKSFISMMAHHPDQAPMFYNNFVHLIGPGIWGHLKATL